MSESNGGCRLILRTRAAVLSVDPIDPGAPHSLYQPTNECIVAGSVCPIAESAAVLILDGELLVSVDVASRTHRTWDLARIAGGNVDGPGFLWLFGADSERVYLWECITAAPTPVPAVVHLPSLTVRRVGSSWRGYMDAMYQGAEQRILLLREHASRYHVEVADLRHCSTISTALEVSTYSLAIGGILSDGRVVLSDVDRLLAFDRPASTADVLLQPGHDASVSLNGECTVFMRGEGELWEWTVSTGERLLRSASGLARLYRNRSYSRPPVVSPDLQWVLWWWEGPPRTPHTELVNRQTGVAFELPYAHDACWLSVPSNDG